MSTHRPARRRRWQGAEESARSWPRSRAMRRRGSPGHAGAERPVVLLPDDTCAVHAVWWASRSGAGGMEVRADPQQGTCGTGTTCYRESCGWMTRASARQAVRVLSMLPQACRTGTTGPWASTAVTCIAALRHGGGRGWGSRAHHGCSETRQGCDRCRCTMRCGHGARHIDGRSSWMPGASAPPVSGKCRALFRPWQKQAARRQG
jgi:hypothetical protein